MKCKTTVSKGLVMIVCLLGSSLWSIPSAAASTSGNSALRAIHRVFGYGWKGRVAICVAQHESHLNPRAVSPTGDYGLFQINKLAHRNWVDFRPFRIFNALYNTRIAYRLSRHGTYWWPWVVYQKGYCR